jgi:pimeloyl-ACP methyl ester carboxylesterase
LVDTLSVAAGFAVPESVHTPPVVAGWRPLREPPAGPAHFAHEGRVASRTIEALERLHQTGSDRRQSSTHSRDVLALIEALGEKQAIVVGHDWGMFAAYSAAGLMPKRMRALITVAIPHPLGFTFMPIIFWPFVLWGHRHFFWLSRRGAADRIITGDMAYLAKLVQRFSPAWKVPPGETDAVKEAFRTQAPASSSSRASDTPPPSRRRRW